MEPTILNFNPKKYRFREWACEALGVTCLERIHEIEKIKALNRSPTTNQLSQYFPEIEDSYRSFVLELLGEIWFPEFLPTKVHLLFAFITAVEAAAYFIETGISESKMGG